MLDNRLSQTFQIIFAGNEHRAQLAGRRCDGLNVEQLKSALSEMLCEVIERHLRCVILSMKHRFTRKESAHRNAVNAAYQFPLAPTLQTVSITQPVQLRVRGNELGTNPCCAAT